MPASCSVEVLHPESVSPLFGHGLRFGELRWLGLRGESRWTSLEKDRGNKVNHNKTI